MRRPGTYAAITAAGLATALAGCALLDEQGPEVAATALAAALTAGELSTAGFADGPGAQEAWDRITEGLGDASPEVHVAEVEEGDGAATATLVYAWDIAGHSWTYETAADLVESAEGWEVEFATSLVEPSLSDGEVLAVSTVPSRRADVLGAGDVPLVTDRPVHRFGIDKTKVGPDRLAGSAGALADLLGLDRDRFVDRVEAAGERAFVPGIVLRSDEVPAEVDSGYPEIPGAIAISDEIPLAPTREFARPILGTVGPVTAEIIEESGGKYEVGDQVGLSGLQRRYDDVLAGTKGLQVEAVAADSGNSRTLFSVEPEPGTPLRTTLDESTQLVAEQVLANVEPASALVAIRPSDGHVLAAASGPGSDGYSTATVGRYPPGSTFKVVTSLALLRAGMSPDDIVECTETTTVNGKAFKNYDDYPAGGIGDITLRTSLAHSCNTSFIHQRDRIPPAELAEAAAALGLGADHDLGFPAELGSVPDEVPATEHAAATIGQGRVIASPMALAAVAASIARGETVVPRLLPDHEVDTPAPAQPLTAGEAERLRDMMRAVVTDGSATFLGDLDGETMAKTGTAEFGDEPPLDTHAWMIAIHGDLAVAAFVEVGESGSRTAGPLVEEFLRAVA